MKTALSAGNSLSYPAEVDFVPVAVGTSTPKASVLLANTSAGSTITISNIAIQG